MNIIKPTHISKFCIDIELIFQTATDLLVLVTQDCCENIKTNVTLITMFTLTTVLIYIHDNDSHVEIAIIPSTKVGK